MTAKEIVKLLMLSPLYFRLSLRERQQLFQEFRQHHKV